VGAGCCAVLGRTQPALHATVRQFGKPTALCFAGGSSNHANLENFDLVFAETTTRCGYSKTWGECPKSLWRKHRPLPHNPWQNPYFLAVLRRPLLSTSDTRSLQKRLARWLAVASADTNDGTVFEGWCHETCLNHGVAVIPRIMPTT